MPTMIRTLGRAVAAALMLGSVAVLAMATGASAQPVPVKTAIVPFAGQFHPINNAGNPSECLQPLTSDFRAPIVQRPCDGSMAQGWAVDPAPSGGTHYRFLNPDGWCISTDSLTNGSPILQDECAVPGRTTVSNAEWNASATLLANRVTEVTLHSRLGFVNSAHCLDEPGGLAGNSNMQIFACNGTNAQNWLISG